jgi:hypothetical protein
LISDRQVKSGSELGQSFVLREKKGLTRPSAPRSRATDPFWPARVPLRRRGRVSVLPRKRCTNRCSCQVSPCWYSLLVLHSEVVIAPYRVQSCIGDLPDLYENYREHAQLFDEFELESADSGELSFFGVSRGIGWPTLTVAQRYWPYGAGFPPGVLVVPETSTVFVGAGERLLAYKLDQPPIRMWSDHAKIGFWRWSREGDYVLMSAELEFAAWTTSGVKLWSAAVEPPWDFLVTDNMVHLDVMGDVTTFSIERGPQAG